eukprot:1797146-Alexandrium_andersonii.AAC.1
MSASLVGSEMCIRDRKGAVREVLMGVPKEGVQKDREETMLRVGDTIPVSYTHLTLPTICSV